MKHYVTPTGEIYAFEEDGSQDAYIRDDMTLLSAEELAELRRQQEEATAPTLEELTSGAHEKRNALLAEAAIRIAPLQDAVDLDEATDKELADLQLWKKYRVAVNRVTLQEGFPASIEWPEQPS